MSLTGGANRKNVLEMLGEFLREAGVLVLVFGFLDLYMTDKPVTFWLAMGIFSVMNKLTYLIMLFAYGVIIDIVAIILNRRRRTG